MDSTGQHLLALKVMRVSRPALASAWEPFYSSSPSFSARSTASIVSLQGKDPLCGHPKTLRDLSNASELLTLPSSFGAIQLGETFSSCLSVNNEAGVDISGVMLKVEMQTATTKVSLAEIGAGSDCELKAGDTMESIVNHEIKELGQHVLACTVSYRLPRNTRHRPEHENDPDSQTFRKFYKFAVTNPLSVKTKVHLPRSPSALMSQTERDKIFLEVHIQNLTQDAMWFQRIVFECADGWDVLDTNSASPDNSGLDELFSGPMALMQPQDMRQYIYILTPSSLSLLPVVHSPGSVIALGRLDICWRSSFGEPGRLLTSMLSRRIPLIAAVAAPGTSGPVSTKNPISALPLHMQKSSSVGGTPVRPRSPQIPNRSQTPPVPVRPQSPSSVPHRPGSPFRSRTTSHRPMSPPAPPPPPPHPSTPDIEVGVTVHDFVHDSVSLEKPFEVRFTLTISAPVPPTRTRSVFLAVQHVLPPRIANVSYAGRQEVFGVNSGRTTPSPTGSPQKGNFIFSESLTRKLLVASPRVVYRDEVDDDNLVRGNNDFVLPHPFASAEDEPRYSDRGVSFLGPSVVFLDPILLEREGDKNAIESREFSLSYMAVRKGFSTVGGLRVLLVGDHLDDEEKEKSEALILKEWNVIGEVWVQG